MPRLFPIYALGVLALPMPAAAAIYTDQASFTAAQPDATFHAFPFTRTVEVDAPYTTSGVTFSAADMLGYNDRGYGTKQSYLETLYGDTQTITYTGSAIGLILGSYFEADTITYTVNGVSGALRLDSRPKTGFLGFTQSTTGPIRISLVQPSSSESLDILGFYTAAAPSVSSVPEPSSWAMLGLGFLFVGGCVRRSARSPSAAR